MSGRLVTCTVAAAGVLVAATMVIAPAAPGPVRQAGVSGLRPVTLLTTKGSIAGLAQDGPWIVWIDAGAPCQSQVKIRRAAGGPVRSLLSKRGVTCTDTEGGGYQSIALAGTRALWDTVFGSNAAWNGPKRSPMLANSGW